VHSEILRHKIAKLWILTLQLSKYHRANFFGMQSWTSIRKDWDDRCQQWNCGKPSRPRVFDFCCLHGRILELRASRCRELHYNRTSWLKWESILINVVNTRTIWRNYNIVSRTNRCVLILRALSLCDVLFVQIRQFLIFRRRKFRSLLFA
jgi:hypothetical protein